MRSRFKDSPIDMLFILVYVLNLDGEFRGLGKLKAKEFVSSIPVWINFYSPSIIMFIVLTQCSCVKVS